MYKLVRLIGMGLTLVFLESCIILPNNDTEWTFPEIEGYLIDSITNRPIENAIVFEKYYGDTIKTDSLGYFDFKAKKEYIKFRIITMDPPKPFIELRFEKKGFLSRELKIEYIKIDYNRIKCDTFDLKQIKLKNNVP